MKTITLLLDGASDRSYAALGNKTPLQYAVTPNLDKIASMSQCGLMTNYQEGVSLSTDLAHMLIFGYKISEYPSRSVIDAIGENIKLTKDNVVMRCSFADVHKGHGYLIKARFTHDLTVREINELQSLLECVIDGYHFRYVHSYDSHGLIIISGAHISDQISDSDPFYVNQYVMQVEPFENHTKEAIRISHAINQYIKRSYDVLNPHEVNTIRRLKGKDVANLILTKWAGSYKGVASFEDRTSMNGLLLGQSRLLKGLATYLKMTYKDYATFDDGLQMALSAPFDYVHLHTKAPDMAAHKKDPFLKVKVLEELDKKLGPLLDFKGLLIVTSDHSTPCSGKMIHSGESVAFMAKGDYIRIDDVHTFDEIACAKGSIHLRGKDFINYILNATDRGALYHLRQGATKKNFILKNVNKLI